MTGVGEGEQAPVKLTHSRHEAAQAWCEIAKALASSHDLEDRQLSQSVVNYARWLPGMRYKPPERQAQRELAGMERSRSGSREPTRQMSPQRTAREPDLER